MDLKNCTVIFFTIIKPSQNWLIHAQNLSEFTKLSARCLQTSNWLVRNCIQKFWDARNLILSYRFLESDQSLRPFHTPKMWERSICDIVIADYTPWGSKAHCHNRHEGDKYLDWILCNSFIAIKNLQLQLCGVDSLWSFTRIGVELITFAWYRNRRYRRKCLVWRKYFMAQWMFSK